MLDSSLTFTGARLAALLFAVIPSLTSMTEPSTQSPHPPVQRRLTMADVIEVTRFTGPIDSRSFSPDGKLFAFTLKKGDLQNNTIIYSLLVLDTDQVFHHPKPKLLVSFASSSNREGITKVTWLGDNDTLFFLGEHPGELTQLYAVRYRTGELTKLTSHPTNVTSYSTSASGHQIVYGAEIPTRDLVTEDVVRRGLHVSPSLDLAELIRGRLLDNFSNTYELFIRRQGVAHDQSLKVKGSLVLPEADLLVLSPNGKYLAVRPLVRAIDPLWNEYEDAELRNELNRDQKLPMGAVKFIQRYEVVDVDTGVSSVLIDAPLAYSGSELMWSVDSRSVIVTGTYLPLSVSDRKLREARRTTTFVAEVTIPDRQVVPITDRHLTLLGREPNTSLWKFEVRPDQTGASTSRVVIYYRRMPEGWESVSGPSQAAERVGPNIFVDESQNAPPRLVAEDPVTTQEVVVFNPNPQLDALSLASVEDIKWKDPAGHEINGGLYLPPDYTPGRKYPLVIQTHGYDPHKFWMDGPYTTAFAAQPLASKEIVVVQLPELAPESAEEADRNLSAFESVIDYLDRRGLIYRDRIGLIGFSRTCYHVEYALTHSRFHFAAASVADGMDAGYFQYIAFINEAPSAVAEIETLIGAAPFGDGLPAWLRNSPGFLLNRVETPVEIQAITPVSLLSEWEWFSGLSRLGKPVDLVYLPNGVHVLEKPFERMVSQQTNVDWFCFWLKGEEDPDPAKTDQYARWRELRKLQEQNEKKAAEEKSKPIPAPQHVN